MDWSICSHFQLFLRLPQIWTSMDVLSADGEAHTECLLLGETDSKCSQNPNELFSQLATTLKTLDLLISHILTSSWNRSGATTAHPSVLVLSILYYRNVGNRNILGNSHSPTKLLCIPWKVLEVLIPQITEGLQRELTKKIPAALRSC